MAAIDLNCDLGESFGSYRMGDDQAMMSQITSASIACGFHAGDPVHIDRAIRLAIAHGTQIGAHPGYPDLAGFGRRAMALMPGELEPLVKYQIGAVKSMVESHGGTLAYVKPHGALYHAILTCHQMASSFATAVRSMNPELSILAQGGTAIAEVCDDFQIRFVTEAFIDRRYLANGRLAPRDRPDATIDCPEDAVAQALRIVQRQPVATVDGKPVLVEAESLCVHGDHPGTVDILVELHRQFEAHGFRFQSF